MNAAFQARNFVPSGEVIAELERSADECDTVAAEMPEPEARRLREVAELCRGWIIRLKYGNWTS